MDVVVDVDVVVVDVDVVTDVDVDSVDDKLASSSLDSDKNPGKDS